MGIGPEQAGHDACIRSTIDCDGELALIGMMMIPTVVGYHLPMYVGFLAGADLYCIVGTVLFDGKSGDSAHNNGLNTGNKLDVL